MELVIVTGPDAGKRVRPQGERFVIGRVRGCDLVLRDTKVSREHAYIRELPDGRLELNDLGSANGTFVGEREVQTAVLGGGERVRFGNTAVEVTADGASPGGPPRPHGESAIRRLLVQAESRATRALALGGVAAAVAVLVVVLALTGTFSGEERTTKAVAGAAPGTVLIETREGAARSGTGSGWVLDSVEGLVVTNAHVINAGTSFAVGHRGRVRPAQVVAAAPCEDLALLRVADAGDLRELRLGRQQSLEQGETVVALGFPENASATDTLTSTTGVVSVVRTTFRAPAPDFPVLSNVIQTDTALNPGNSGGPLVDLEARVVGVNSAARTRGVGGRIIQGQSYAIGIDRVREVVPELRRGRSIGWLGMGFEYPTASELAEARLPEGIFVPRSAEGTSAAEAGVAEGSPLLVSVDGTAVGHTLQGYCDAVRGIPSGRVVTVVLADRTGRTRSVRLRFE